MGEALARVGAAIDKWAAEQRLRKWAKSLADDANSPPDQVKGDLLGRSAKTR
jgi:hypothetical protein